MSKSSAFVIKIKSMRLALTIFICFLFTFLLEAQITLNAGGENEEHGDGSISYSIGEIFYQTEEKDGWVLISGIQNGYELYSTTKGSYISNNIDISIYPNPTTDYIELNLNDLILNNYCAVLYDNSGRVLKQFDIKDSLIRIAMSPYPSGTYLLQIIARDEIIEIFKIIKK